MPPPTAADLEVIEYAASRGVRIESRQLKRWRTAGLLPARRVRGRGRGRGVSAEDRPWTRFQVVAVANALALDRNVDRAALRLWYDGWDIATNRISDLVRTHVEAELDRYETTSAQLQRTTELHVSAFDVAEELSRTTPIRRDERERMRGAPRDNRDKETDADLVHAARSALMGQLFSPAEEHSAIPAELISHLMVDPRARTLIEQLDFDAEPALTAFEQLLTESEPSELFTSPDADALKRARDLLRQRYEAPEMLAAIRQLTVDEPFVAVVIESLEALPRDYDTRHPEYRSDRLLTALTAAAIPAIT